MVKGSSGSQASTLVARGSGSGADSKAAPRSTPVGTVRRRTPARGGAQTRSSYFVTDDSSLITLSPTSVIGMAVGFIVFVFILHIFGKLKSA